MGSTARDHGDPGLLAFIGQLLEDSSLEDEAAAAARKLLERGADALNASERVLIEQEVVEPYCTECEACHVTPGWDQMLHVYDTGLCAGCFDKLEGVDVPEVRPEWMPLAAAPPEDDELPVEDPNLVPLGA